MIGLYIAAFPPEVSLPPLFSDQGGFGQLAYQDGSGQWMGGYSCVGQVPETTTCIVRVDTSAAMHTWLQAQPQYVYVPPAPEVL